jgi:hypothetical protein
LERRPRRHAASTCLAGFPRTIQDPWQRIAKYSALSRRSAPRCARRLPPRPESTIPPRPRSAKISDVLTSASTVALLVRVSRERKPIIGIILAETTQRDTLCSQHPRRKQQRGGTSRSDERAVETMRPLIPRYAPMLACARSLSKRIPTCQPRK